MSKPSKLKNGRWRVVARYKNIITGTWTSKTKTFDSSAEARAWQAETIANANLGKTTKSVTLGQYFPHWLELYKKPFVEEKTIKRITVDMNHALSFFTPYKHMDEITKGNYQLWLNTEATNYSHQTVRSMHNSFKAMMNTAVDEGVIFKNPCIGAKFAGVEEVQSVKHPKQKVLTLDEFKRLLTTIEQSDDCASKYLCLLQAFTGVRIGEALGLEWSKIDFEHHTILIDGQYDYSLTRKRIHLKDHTKPRTIIVEPMLVNYLSYYRKWQQRQFVGRKVVNFSPYSYLFTDIQGTNTPINPTSVNKFLERKCKDIGITRITSHGWRRTQATLMTLAQIDPKFIANYLGHSVDTLQRYYVIETDDLIKQGQQMRTNFMENQVLGND